MKKMIAVVLLVGFAAVLAAQEPPTKQLSIQEANQLNGTPKEPTINGKPYSQYKAEQEALKKQQAAKPAAHMANLPKGMSITANTETADPALERMNEQAKHGMPQAEDKRTLPPVTDEKFVKNQSNALAPEAFEMPTQEQWQTIGMNKPVVETALASQDPSAKQSKANSTPVQPTKQAIPAGIGGEISIEENPQPAKPGAPETEKPKQPVTAPEVPSQFRLPATTQSWTGRVADSKPVNQAGDPAQPVDAKISAVYQPAATPKPASTQKAGQEGGAGKPTPVIEASMVKTPAKDAASGAAPQLPADLSSPTVRTGTTSNVPATVPAQNNPVAPGSVMGTPAEQNKPATEKPAKQH